MKFYIALFGMFLAVGGSYAGYQVVATFDSPDTQMSGLGFGNGYLWGVGSRSRRIHQLDPASCATVNSWDITPTIGTIRSSRGLTFGQNTIYVICGIGAVTNDYYCYKFSSSGSYTGKFDLTC